MKTTRCDVLVVGGGTGGCAAAMAATSMGMRVVMTEETDWIGGQLTSQAVPPDEHPWIEQFGCTARYRRYRNLVRRFYREHTPLREEVAEQEHLNPGGGWVSKLCHEPRIGWQVLNEMLQPAITRGLLDVRLFTKAWGAEVAGDRVTAVVLRNVLTGEEERVEFAYVLDATELGDLLPMTGTDYVTGAESRDDTGEPNAVIGMNQPHNVQGLTWIAALAYDPDGRHQIDKPSQYEFWRDYQPSFWPDKLLSFKMLHVRTGEPVDFPLFGKDAEDWFNLFEYRQIVKPENFQLGAVPHPVTIANWPQNDYFEGNIIDETDDVVQERLHAARQLTLSLVYWLQTEAGYPGIYLRGDVLGTGDGLAKYPYIRESRRIHARFTVCEQHVAAYTNPGVDRAPEFADSVGIGAYRIDLHPSTSGANTIDTSSLPFQVPLGSLVPVKTQNLLPACKNLGVTHITNGCYRLHPVEWNIGESAGALAAYCVQQGTTPAAVYEDKARTEGFQTILRNQGVELEWPKLGPL